jgi:hypothetical protein
VAAGYSGTPLAKKLGIGSSTRVFLSGAPKHYLELVAPVPKGARIVRKIDDGTDIVHVFATERARLAPLLRSTLAKLRPDAAIWVSWPKKSSKVRSDITEDTIREIALPMGLVDIKVCAVDEVWSGLKLVLRKQNRRKGDT